MLNESFIVKIVSTPPKAPSPYRPNSPRVAAPLVCRPQTVKQVTQPKQPNIFKLESRPAPPVYRPQSTVPSQLKTQALAVQPQSQYELSPPVWTGNRRQQIRVRARGAPTPIGSV